MIHPLIDHIGSDLYDFKGTIPPWVSYCRACLRRAGLDPRITPSCPDAVRCPHYPFKFNYMPKEV